MDQFVNLYVGWDGVTAPLLSRLGIGFVGLALWGVVRG
jgi:hypothetical protein